MNGFDTRPARGVLVLSLGDASADQTGLRHAFDFLRERGRSLNVRATAHRGCLVLDLSVPRGEHPQVVLRRIGEALARAVREKTGQLPWVALNTLGATAGVETAVRELRETIRLADRAWRTPSVLTRDDVLVVEAVLGDRTLLRRLAQVLDPLTAQSRLRRVDLVEALETYLAHNMSASIAARKLSINRRTLEYRVKRAEELLGRSLGRIQDRVLIEAALIARRMSEDSPTGSNHGPSRVSRADRAAISSPGATERDRG